MGLSLRQHVFSGLILVVLYIDYVYVCLCRMVGMCVYSFDLAAVYDPYCIVVVVVVVFTLNSFQLLIPIV